MGDCLNAFSACMRVSLNPVFYIVKVADTLALFSN
jgi:hypothetical protein